MSLELPKSDQGSNSAKLMLYMIGAGSLAGFQPSVNQTKFLEVTRAMPWQEDAQKTKSVPEPVYIVAGNAAGLVHVLAVAGSGQNTWQTIGVQQQVRVHTLLSCPHCTCMWLQFSQSCEIQARTNEILMFKVDHGRAHTITMCKVATWDTFGHAVHSIVGLASECSVLL